MTNQKSKILKQINFKFLKKSQRISIKHAGQYIYFFYNLSGSVVVDIKCSGAKVYLFGLYIGKKKQSFNINTIQHHLAPGSSSDLLIKGVFFDRSNFNYHGLIKIGRKAQKSNAYQKNQNLIMSDGVLIESKPDLEILADDVRCTHGSTTGQINQDWLYYLASRGLDYQQAKKLITSGFIAEIFDKMKSKGVVIPDQIGDLHQYI